MSKDYFDIQQKKIRIFADGAKSEDIRYFAPKTWIDGFTTNPSLLAKAGVSQYETHAKSLIQLCQGKALSLEVIADEPTAMLAEARYLQSLGNSVWVKVPIMNTQGQFLGPVIQALQAEGIQLNVTAVFTTEQVNQLLPYLSPKVPLILSVFAGRIADTGRDPTILLSQMQSALAMYPMVQVLWASCREIYNICEAEKQGCQIITVPAPILYQLEKTLGKSLAVYSLETVQSFYEDAQKAGIHIALPTQKKPSLQGR